MLPTGRVATAPYWRQGRSSFTPPAFAPPMPTPIAALRFVTFLLSFVLNLAAQTNWELQGDPSSRRGTELAFDPVRGETVMFGGNDGTLRDETWIWDGVAWQLRQPPVRPSPREDVAMTWDSVHQRVLLFGGFGSLGATFLDLWAWDGSTWTQLMPSTPSLGQNQSYSLVHDPLRDRVVLLSESSGSVNLSEWNGTSWTNVTPTSPWPLPNFFSSAVFDPLSARTVYYAPTAGTPRLWRWNGTAWTSQVVTGASSQALARLVHDPVGNRLLLVGGNNPSNTNTLFGLNAAGTSWQTLASGGPRAVQCGACYDTVRNRLVLVGGTALGSWVDSSVWEWSGGPWERRTAAPPGARHSPSVAFDATTGRTWLFGGVSPQGDRGDLWSLDGNGWQIRWREDPLTFAPGTTQGRRIVYDEARQQLLLLAGGSSGFPFWRFTGSAWQPVGGTVPTARSNPGVVYDQKRARVFLFGGDAASGGRLDDTWVYDGTTWTRLFPSNVPPAASRPGIAYDRVRDRVVMQGGDVVQSSLSDTWEFDGVDWQQFPGTFTLQAVRDPALAYDVAREVVVALAFGPTNGALRTWQWNGATWTEALPNDPPPTRSLPGLLPTPAGLLSFGGVADAFPVVYPSDRRLLRSPFLATSTAFGLPGVSVAGPLTLAVTGSGPWLGSRVHFDVAGVPPIALPGLWAGSSRTQWNGAPLPADLALLGWPDTIVRVALEIFVPVLNLGTGSARAFVDLPPTPTLVGLELHLQAFTFEPLNGALTASNGLSLTTGLR